MDQLDQYIFAMETQRTVITQLIIRITSSITKKIIVIPPEMIPNLTTEMIPNLTMSIENITMTMKNMTMKMKNMMTCLSVWRTVASKKLILVHRKAHVHGFTPKHQNTTQSLASSTAPLVLCTTLITMSINSAMKLRWLRKSRILSNVSWIAQLKDLIPTQPTASAHGSAKQRTTLASMIAPTIS